MRMDYHNMGDSSLSYYEFAEIVAASGEIRFCRLYIFSTAMLQLFLTVMVNPELQFLTFGDNFFFFWLTDFLPVLFYF